MIRGNRILCLTVVLFLLVSCASPSVISIDLAKDNEEVDQETASTSVPDPTPEPEPTPTENFLDCETDLDCFYASLGSCQKSSLDYYQSLDMMGAEISTTLHIEVIGPLDGICEFSVITDEVKISFSDEAVQQLLDSGISEEEIEVQRLTMEQSQASAGFDETCSGNPEDLIQTLQRWEQGQFSMTDWDPFTCEGKIFTSIETVPETAEAPSPTSEPQPARDGNLLANMSFEIDPVTVQPSWYVDPKGTDLIADWTMDQFKEGQYSLMVSASTSANKGFPGWFLTNPIPVEGAVWHVVQVWAMTPDGADAFVSADFLDENGGIIEAQSTGCVDLDPNTWNKVGFGILGDRLEGVSSIRLGLQQCLLNTEGKSTTIYYDEIYLGITPP